MSAGGLGHRVQTPGSRSEISEYDPHVGMEGYEVGHDHSDGVDPRGRGEVSHRTFRLLHCTVIEFEIISVGRLYRDMLSFGLPTTVDVCPEVLDSGSTNGRAWQHDCELDRRDQRM